MAKELRAELHERFARWLEQHRSEFDEIVGYHYEQAYRLREELAPLDSGASAVAQRGGQLLGRAGLRAFDRGDVSAATNLLARATELLAAKPDDPLRLDLLVQLGYALQSSGDFDRARHALDAAVEGGEASGNAAVAARAELGRHWVAAQAAGTLTDLSAIEQELARLEKLQDEVGLAEGWTVAATFQAWLGHSKEAGSAYARASEHARRAGSRRLATTSLGYRLMLEAWGHRPAGEGLAECNELLEANRGTAVEAWILSASAHYLSLLGNANEARDVGTRAPELARKLGLELQAAGFAMNIADQALRVGDPQGAEAAAREGIVQLESLGEQGYLSTTTSLLAEALYRQGRLEEAEEATRRVEEIAAADDFDPQVRYRSVRAKVLARRGNLEPAEALAREAVALAARTDWYAFHAMALSDLAEILRLAGRGVEAARLLEEAVALYERKGARVDAEQARHRLAELEASA
jgi:tetratricopeptide (TPR) repeat protein